MFVSRSARLIGLAALAGYATAAPCDTLADGRNLAFARDKGNCLACHVIDGGRQMGDIGPPLVAMRQRFPERQRLVQQLRDPGRFNSRSVMPPYGRHEILTAAEIDAIVEFLYSL